MYGYRVSGDYDDGVRLVGDVKVIGNSAKKDVYNDLRVVEDWKIIGNSDRWTSGVLIL